jgi:hypothetical protein
LSGIVLDAGALIALEKNDRGLWLALRAATVANRTILVPSTVVAQVWRGGSAQAHVARALNWSKIAGFDGLERAVGELCAKTRTSDICDAHVALVAAREGDVLYTSDPDDLRPLIAAARGRRPIVLTC